MALDFHRLDNKEHLFGLDDKKYSNLDEIFIEFKNSTGVFIDQYNDLILRVDNQKVLLKIADNCIQKINLNVDKQKTIDIIEFRTFMFFLSSKNINLKVLGD